MQNLQILDVRDSTQHADAKTPYTDADITDLVELGAQHADAAYSSVFAFGLDVLGDIDLPPGSESQVDRAQMRALGALYLAADLEPAGIITAAENLAALATTGAINVDLGPVAAPLRKFWRSRNSRINSRERAAFFGRLFGVAFGQVPADGTINQDFETLMLGLCEALYRLGDRTGLSVQGSVAQSARVRGAARNLLSNLVATGGGATPFLATEIMNTLKQALAILKHPHLRGIFAGRDLWDVVAAINRRARVQMDDPRLFVRRGRAGMEVIIWLAEAALLLRQYGQPTARLDDPVISAAVDWLQSSLAISERVAIAPPVASADTSPWAQIGL